MSELMILSAPILLAAAGGWLVFENGRTAPTARRILGEGAAATALAIALAAAAFMVFDGGVAGAVVLFDAVAATMLVLISFVGWVVMRYSVTCMRDEAGGSRFLGYMALALAAVMILVVAGTLWLFLAAWVATSLALQRLLLFYRDRRQARMAARRQRWVALSGDAVLGAAFCILAFDHGSVSISGIADRAGSGSHSNLEAWAAGLLAVAALLKSAQLPFHGWLTKVMEAPTPVSALLHAGIVNAGGFLLIRFADVVVTAPGIMAALVAVGGLTALVAGLVMLTQSAVKTALAWSTVAQMGFMVMQCGLGLFAFALLHLAAHSLYKAHAFLAAGSVVQRIAAARQPGPVAIPSVKAVALAFAAAIVVFGIVAAVFAAWTKPPQAVALGLILVFGVAYMFAQGLADAAPAALTRRTALYAGAVTVSYFLLQEVATRLSAGSVPAVPEAGALEWVLIVLGLTSFGAVAFAQALFPLWASHPAVAGLRVHLQNGLYLDLLYDRNPLPGTSVKEVNA